VQIFRIIRLGEQELDESLYQVLCFVTHLPKNEFISSDAMSKLRQVCINITIISLKLI
jgi:hypothetical protein